MEKAKRYKKKIVVKKTFFIRKLVKMKYKEGGLIDDNINEFQSAVKPISYNKNGP